MQEIFPIPLKEKIESNSNVDPIDVVVVKRSLSRLGYFNEKNVGLTPFPNKELFAGIRNLQSEQELVSDGVMRPGGPTAKRIGLLLSPAPGSPRYSTQFQFEIAQSSPLREDQCDYLYWNVDIPVCRAIERKKGKRVAAICYHTA